MTALKESCRRLLRLLHTLPERIGGDYIMAMNRLLFGSFMFGMCFVLGDSLPLSTWRGPVATWIACSTGLLMFLIVAPHAHTVRRNLAMLLDVGGTTIMLLAGGQGTAFLYVVYHWIVIGNGYRFGGRYTVLGSAASLAGFMIVVRSDPFWRGHISLSFGLLSGLVLLPAYSFMLIQKLDKARQEAEQANKAKSLFLASVSHELRTPLNAIVGTVELLGDTPLDLDQRTMIRAINTAADSQLSLVRDVLSFASMEAGQARLHVADFDLADVLEKVRSLVEPGARLKGLWFDCRIAPSTPLLVRGDERRICEVLLNICSNAVKFTEAGSVTLDASGAEWGDGRIHVRFEVADTGIGIRPEARNRIFELFTQADETILNRFGGTGLGLTLCKRQVELMGGEIGVDSTLDAGSTFWVTLSLVRAKADCVASDVAEGSSPAVPVLATPDGPIALRVAAVADVAGPAGRLHGGRLEKLRVLIADDNEINRSILGRMLKQAGLNPLFAKNGEQALAVLSDGKVDVALLDVNMPVLNGIEAAKHYAFSTIGANPVPLIALTADATTATRDLCLQAGMQAVLVKPVRTANLLDTLEAVLPAEVAGPIPAMQATPETLDPDRLDALLELGGTDFVVSLVNDFVRDGSLILAEIADACLSRDLGQFRTAAHALASVSANMGAARVSALCSQWQGMPETEFGRRVAYLPVQVRAAWTETAVAFQDWRSRRAAPTLQQVRP